MSNPPVKTAFMVLSLAFAAACCGLWAIIQVLQMLHNAYPAPEFHGGRLSHGYFEIMSHRFSSWLPFLGIPAVGYAAFVSVRGKARVERFCLFGSVLALALVILVLPVILVCMVSWVYVYD
jgi:hypothetical protein